MRCLTFLEQLTNSRFEIEKPSNFGELQNLYLFDDNCVMTCFDNPAKLPPLPGNPCAKDLETFTEYGNNHLAHQFQGGVVDSLKFLEEWGGF